MKKTLTQKFIDQIQKIKEPQVFIGVARILKVPLLEDSKEPRDFYALCADTIQFYQTAPQKRKKELLKILRQANQYKEQEG